MKATNPLDANRLCFGIDELAAACGISRGLIFKLQREGQGPRMVELGRRRVVLRDDALTWLRSRARPAK